MKKLLSITLLLALVTGLSGCDSAADRARLEKAKVREVDGGAPAPEMEAPKTQPVQIESHDRKVDPRVAGPIAPQPQAPSTPPAAAAKESPEAGSMSAGEGAEAGSASSGCTCSKDKPSCGCGHCSGAIGVCHCQHGK